jgi:hypothetical protein
MNESSTIADASQPNAGRIYDYLLGGHHNFEVDRQVAENLLQVAPFMPQVLKMIRWFLGEATRRLLAEEFDKFIDFASGLPTMDHIHQLAQPGTKVIYSDIDPVTVEYGREIIKDNKHVRYVECNAGKPEELLNSSIVEKLFGEDRKVAIGFNGIAYFLPDESLKHALEILYDWADKGSKIFLSDADADTTEVTKDLKPVFDLYSKIGQPIHIRSRSKLQEMAGAWNIDEPGFLTLDEWIGMGEKVTEQEIDHWGGRGFYGAILYK